MMLKFSVRSMFLAVLFTGLSLISFAQTPKKAKPVKTKPANAKPANAKLTKAQQVKAKLALAKLAKAQQASVKNTLAILYGEADRALIAKDITGATKYLAPDYFQVNSKGKKMNRAQFLAKAQQTFASAETIEGLTTINKLVVKGGTATVDTEIEATITTASPDGSKHEIDTISTAREFWMKTPTGWQIKRSRLLTEKTLANRVVAES